MKLSIDEFRSLKNRDKKILKDFYLAYADKIYNYLLAKLNGDANLAEELTSETFCSAISSIHSLKNINTISSWLYKIASNIFNAHLRKKYIENKYLHKLKEDDSFEDNIIEKIYDKNKKVLFDMAYDTLNNNYKEIIDLKYKKDKSLKEIASIKNKSEKAVENILYKARIKLSKEINKLLEGFNNEL